MSGTEPRADDERLMREIRSGSGEAFRLLMKRWQTRLYRFFVFMGSDPHEAEDCVQETFLRLYGYRDRYRPGPQGGLRPFLFRLARNVSIDAGRRRKLRGWVPLEEEAPSAPRSEDPEPRWGLCMDLAEALDALGEAHRIVVVLNVYGGLSYAEIAELLGVPLGTVKSRMHYAIARLREHFGVGLERPQS